MRDALRYAFCFFIICFHTFIATAQVRARITHFSPEDGLPHNSVLSMIKDREGFMWFGTWDGISRYDGNDFLTYKSKPGDRSGLLNNRIDRIIEDKQGYLWLKANDRRIYRFDKHTEKFLPLADKMGSLGRVEYLKAVPSLRAGVWLFTNNHGINFVPPQENRLIAYHNYSLQAAPSSRLQSNKINFLYEDHLFNTWVGNQGGLALLSPTANPHRPYSLRQLFSGQDFRSVSEDEQSIWLGTADGYLVRWDKRTRKFSKKKIHENSLNGLLSVADGKELYITTGSGELLLLDKKMQLLKSVSISPGSALFSIYKDRKGGLWIEPEKHGVIHVDRDNKTFQLFRQKNDSPVFYSSDYYRVYEDENGLVWSCMKGGGFGYFDEQENQMKYFHNGPSVADHQFSNMVTASYYDPLGVLWLSTETRGIEKVTFLKNDFKVKKILEGSIRKADNETRAFFNDSKGRFWLATKASKLYCFKQGKPIALPIIDHAKTQWGRIYDILEDTKGNIWFASRENGLFKAIPVDPQMSLYKITHFKHSHRDPYSLSSNVVYDIFEDNRGRIWVATCQNGINLISLKDGKEVFINRNNQLKNYPKQSHLLVRNLAEDNKGNIWAATTEGLLIVGSSVDKSANYKIVTYSKKEGDPRSLGNNDVQYIYKSSAGQMWLGTSGGGLNLAVGRNPLDSLHFDLFTTKNGLSSDFILSMTQSQDGTLWLASQKGIINFNPKDQKVRNFDAEDGVDIEQFSEASVARLTSGEIIFGSSSGLLTFNPAQVRQHRAGSALVFTKLQVNNKDVYLKDLSQGLDLNINYAPSIKLRHDQNIFSIHFTTLDYRTSKKQKYRYRLTGFDREWQNNANQRILSYTNLSPGKYLLEVEVAGSELYSNKPYKSLRIEILPPFWKTWWAYLFYTFLIFGLAVIVYRTLRTVVSLRNKVIVEKKMGDLRQEFFTNMSHELRTPLTLILNPLEQMLEKEQLSVQARDLLSIARKHTGRMVKFVNQFLDLSKIQRNKLELSVSKVEIVSFTRQVAELFTEIAQVQDIKLIVSANVNELFVWVDGEKIDIVLYNLLSNAFKFAPRSTAITISINSQPDEKHFTIEVIDQGKGVAKDKLEKIFELYYHDDQLGESYQGKGIGLAFSKALIELHQGKIQASDNPGGGLNVSISLLCGHDHFASGELVDFKQSHFQQESFYAETMIRTSPAFIAGKSHVLLVEDNGELRDFLQSQLSDRYNVTLASDGAQGLSKALDIQPDLILSDIMMPVMNGLAMLDSLKKNERTSHIPVILLSAKQSVQSQIEGLEYGADFYIGKPFSNALLFAAIDSLIKKRRNAFQQAIDNKEKFSLKPLEVVITTYDQEFLKKVVAIVSERMADQEFNIDFVADYVGMSRSAFFKKFKALTDLAPVEFVKDMRIKRAKEYLDAGERNISSIAYAVGFANAKYFAKCFKAKIGLNPSDYIKEKMRS